MDTFLQNGVRSIVASVPEGQHREEDVVAVLINGGKIPWVLRFWVRLGTNRVYLGAVRTFASRTHRCVAILAAPGALGFEVEGKGIDTTVDYLDVHFEGTMGRGGPWGVSAIPGNSVAGCRSYRVETGVGSPAVVTVTGEVHGWAAYTAQVGGTVLIQADPNLVIGPIGVPQNVGTRGNAMGLLAPVSTWTFAAVDRYMIEYIPPGTEFDG